MQLSLLPAFELERVLDAANRLLDTLNDGRKIKESYSAHNFFFYNGVYVFRASQDKNPKFLFNALDEQGKIPSGFSANWRDISHIKQELQL